MGPQRVRTKEFERTRFAMRWGLLPRVRLLRGAVYERMGKSAEAEQASVGGRGPPRAVRQRVEGAQFGTPPPGGRRP
ncbi:MAG TPA: hypothetical protein VEU27_16345 [Gemmatimonadales bacterium]|nr:hypothetical protein [Gemmatimonadales bacterium]